MHFTHQKLYWCPLQQHTLQMPEFCCLAQYVKEWILYNDGHLSSVFSPTVSYCVVVIAVLISCCGKFFYTIIDKNNILQTMLLEKVTKDTNMFALVLLYTVLCLTLNCNSSVSCREVWKRLNYVSNKNFTFNFVALPKQVLN